MTCFWNGIIDSLTPKERDILQIRRPIYKELIPVLKQKNTKPISIKWNGKLLTSKEQNEFVEHIKSYDIKTARNGYYCSVCDPFLALISHLLEVRIVHNYLGKQMIYEPNIQKLKGEKIFSSDKGHFRYKNRKIYQL